MKFAEVIQIRTFNEAALNQAIKEANDLLLLNKLKALERVELWIRNDLETDICLVLSWASDEDRDAKTNLGMELAELFSQYGWVLHSVWGRSRETEN